MIKVFFVGLFMLILTTPSYALDLSCNGLWGDSTWVDCGQDTSRDQHSGDGEGDNSGGNRDRDNGDNEGRGESEGNGEGCGY